MEKTKWTFGPTQYYCDCCLCYWCHCCFVAKKQGLWCLNILFSRNLRTISLGMFAQHPISKLTSQPVTYGNHHLFINKSKTRNTVRRSGRPHIQTPHQRQPRGQSRHLSKWNNQIRKSISVELGLTVGIVRPFLHTALVHMEIWIPRARDGATRNRVLDDSRAKDLRDALLRSSWEDRVWCTSHGQEQSCKEESWCRVSRDTRQAD